MQIIRKADIPILSNSGVNSEQIIFPESSPDAGATITRVTVPAGTINPRHVHKESEQIWFVLSGRGMLLLEDETEREIYTGDVARFSPGDIHGFHNTNNTPFVYISVTTPPLNFRGIYDQEWEKSV